MFRNESYKEIRKEKKTMKDFILAALPWVVATLFLAVLIIRRNISKNKEKKAEDYSTEGMSIGMCLGCAVGASNIMNIGIALSLGMLFGLAIGMLIKKGESREKDS